MSNQFDEGFSQVQHLFQERTNALHEASMLRSKVIQLEESDRILKNQNTLLQRVVAQQKAMIDKVKSQRKELLSFYKLNKKHEINKSQIKS